MKGLEVGQGWLSAIGVGPLPAALPFGIFVAVEVLTAATVLKPGLERVALFQKVDLAFAHVDDPCRFIVWTAPFKGLAICQ
jgi:hypothetical protein